MMMRKTGSPFIATATLSLFCVASAWAQSNTSAPSDQPQVVQPDEGGVNWKGVGIGAGTVAGNLVYVPAKLVYGILGGIAGGAGYALTGGNKQVADTIWRSSLGGDYVLTPDMITGDKPVRFSGPNATAPATPADSAGPTSANVAESTPNTSTSMSSGAAGSASVPATNPIDSGAGPVGGPTVAPMADPAGGAGNSANSYPSSRRGAIPTYKAPPLPDTSIE
jgi:hypothetical protein